MGKYVLQVSFDKRKPPKTKLGRWWYWNVTGIWWPGAKAKFFGAIANFIYWLAPKSWKEQWDKEWEEEFGNEIPVVFKDNRED